MPNKCTKCGKLHSDDANYLLSSGCDSCGGRFFFFVRDLQVREIDEEVSHITKSEMKEIEKDIRSIIPIKVPIKVMKKKGEGKKQKGETIILDIEAIRVIKPGKYQINVETLFNQKPIVVKVGTGKYEIDFSVLAGKFRANKL